MSTNELSYQNPGWVWAWWGMLTIISLSGKPTEQLKFEACLVFNTSPRQPRLHRETHWTHFGMARGLGRNRHLIQKQTTYPELDLQNTHSRRVNWNWLVYHGACAYTHTIKIQTNTQMKVLLKIKLGDPRGSRAFVVPAENLNSVLGTHILTHKRL